jgi:opacity protein-like surface antigen
MFKANKILLALLASTAFVASAQANSQNSKQAPYKSHWYLGAGIIAPSETDSTGVETFYDQSGQTYNYTTREINKQHTGWSLIAGYRATVNWGVEFGFYDNGKYTQSSTYVDQGFLPPTTPGKIIHSTANGHDYNASVSVLRYINFGETPFSMLLRLGGQYHYFKTNDSISDFSGDTASFTQEKAGLIYGLGIQYVINQKIDLRVEYTLFGQNSLINNLNHGKFMLSANYNL